ncbi:NADH dehydrogenase (ubiquinone) complex I, assembly factor 6-like [Daphnia pulex]|uniref:NADH dehydrogenase (ubiquinone) complex I, assembly factor 6-like n=1 Tax=Daphnia pulex TaxID=6669 RepID=UPI001EDCC366|nr:NADH dehydrogenase (ubiquinone) complex I, assembly factor 6-like [Daphnia pulex]XP_046463493.1 NADH dehydrogenase (ubiquinone) complex I, assembly factor 6-like [Daphnia pulex]
MAVLSGLSIERNVYKIRSIFFVARKLSSKVQTSKNSFLYCQELVRKHDYENFLAALLLPPASRQSTIAVRAFNVSLAQVQDQVSQGTIGQMRMKFWSETLEAVYQNTPPAQLVALQLYEAVQRHNLSKRWLQRLISSRENHLSSKAFQSLSKVEDYAEHSVSSVLYLTLESLNIRKVDSDHAASHIGRAQGLVTLLRAIPYNSKRQQVYVPLDLLVQHKVSQNDFLRGSDDKKVKDLIFDVASTANAHIQKARTIIPKVPSEAKIALMPLISVDSYLDQLRAADFNVFDPKLSQRNNLLPWKLWWNKFRGKI